MDPAVSGNDEPIFDLASQCETLFLEHVSRLRGQHEIRAAKVLEDYQQRFATWAAVLGVYAQNNICLDRRLQDHIEIKNILLRILDLMKRNLAHVLQTRILPNEIIVEQPHIKGISSTNIRLNMENLRAIEGSIERLNHLGIAIRQSSISSQMSKAKIFAEKFDFTPFAKYSYLTVKTLYPDATDGLAEQLSQSMVETYSLFRWRTSRQEQRQAIRRDPSTLQTIPEESSITQDTRGKLEDQGTQNPITRNLPGARMEPTTAQSHLPQQLSHGAPSSFDSSLFRAQINNKPSSNSRPSRPPSLLTRRVNYPKPPHKTMICDWCFLPISGDELEGDNWRKHMNRDHEPFVCISEQCLGASQRFPTSTQWFEHMITKHGSRWHREVHMPWSWVCPWCSDAKKDFAQAHELTQHISDFHADIGISEPQVQMIVQHSRLRIPREHNVCPLCCFSMDDAKPLETEGRPTGLEDHQFRDQEHSRKRLKTETSNAQLDFQKDEKSQKIFRRQDVDVKADPSPGRTLNNEMVAKHVASHLQQIMLLTLRMISIDNENVRQVDDDNTSTSSAGNTSRLKRDFQSQDNLSFGSKASNAFLDENGSDPKKYTVGWICAIQTEYVAACAFLDEEHEQVESLSPIDNNSYAFGRIGPHNVVVAVLPDGEYGTSSAATVARDMMYSFPNVRIGLMVGIGGGAPRSDHDIRLGDIVVSSPSGGTGGVLQYDYGKAIQGQEFYHTGFLNQPPASLRTAVVNLRATYELEGHGIKAAIEHALQKNPRLKRKYGRPDGASDRLFKSNFVHPKESGISCEDTCNSNPSNIVVRRQRDEEEDDPAVHYGLIASANRLMKDAVVRDTLAREHNVLCFEMEAAGLMNHFPCLVICGICDYADSHKNKQWQGFAAMTAAAYTKDLLCHIAPNRVEAERRLSEVLLPTIVEQLDPFGASPGDARPVQWESRTHNWLSPPDPSAIFNKSVAQRHPETGQWFLRSSSFTDWMMGKTRFLWLYGIPGCGKTILSSTIIKELKDRRTNDQTILYYYFTFSDKSMQNNEGMMRSLIAQMIAARIEGTQKYVDQLYADCANGTQQPSFQQLLHTLRDMLRGAGHVYIIVDALDGCENRGNGLFHEIRELQLIPETHLIVTSRMEQDIKSSIGAWAREQDMISIQSNLVADDIRAYVHTRVREHGLSRWRSRPEIQEEIEAALLKKADGMFRWVYCQLDALERCLDVCTLRQALATVPKTLDKTYAQILHRISRENQRPACLILQFLAYSDGPLSLETLVDVIAVVPEQHPGFTPEHRVPIPEEILYYCTSLVTRTTDSTHSGGSILIHLAHHSIKKYLTSYPLDGYMAESLNETSAKASIAKVCLSYLLSLNENSFEDAPLTRYAANYWPLHAAETSAKDDLVYRLLMEFLSSENFHWATAFLASDYRDCDLNHPLRYAASLGLIRIFRNLLNRDTNYSREQLYSALCSAVAYGQEEMVQFLLDTDTGMATYDSGALFKASISGHESIVRLLLEKGADVNAANQAQKTALHDAAENGHAGTVSVLLSKGADHNAQDIHRETALHYAAERNHLGTTKVLVSQGASLDAVDSQGRTPLGCAQKPLSGPFKGETCVETIEYLEVVMKERKMAAKADQNQA